MTATGQDLPLNPAKLTEKQRASLREVFALFDLDRDGTISAGELGDLMRKLGQAPTNQSLRKMVAQVDTRENGKIDFNEFCILAARLAEGERLSIRENDLYRHRYEPEQVSVTTTTGYPTDE